MVKKINSIFDFPEDATVSEMQRVADEWCREWSPMKYVAGHGRVTAEPVQLLTDSGILPDFEAARDLLESADRPEFHTWVVRYRGVAEKSEETKAAEKRKDEAQSDCCYISYVTNPTKRGEEVITCPECGVKLQARKLPYQYESTGTCPVCGGSLRNEEERARLEEARRACYEADREVERCERRDKKRSAVRWALIVETIRCH